MEQPLFYEELVAYVAKNNKAYKKKYVLATDIDDDSIEYLKQMKNLKHLRIFETKISEEGFRNLKKFLPDCHISYNHSHY